MTNADAVLELFTEANPVPTEAEQALGIIEPPDASATASIDRTTAMAALTYTGSPTSPNGLLVAAVAAVLVLLTGAAWFLVSATRTPSPEPTAPLEAGEAAISAFNSGDLERYLELLAPEAEMRGVTVEADPASFRDMVAYLMVTGSTMELECAGTGTPTLIECTGTMPNEFTRRRHGLPLTEGTAWFLVEDGLVEPSLHGVMAASSRPGAEIATWIHEEHPDMWAADFTPCGGSGNCVGVPPALFRMNAAAGEVLLQMAGPFSQRFP